VWDNDEIDLKDIHWNQHGAAQRLKEEIYSLRAQLREAEEEIADLKKAPQGWVRSGQDPRVILEQMERLREENNRMRDLTHSLNNSSAVRENAFRRELERIESNHRYELSDGLYRH